MAVRAWAVLRGAGDELVPMEYEVPWGYLFHLQRDLLTLRDRGLPHLVATAGRDGDWLGNWVSEYFDAPEVHAAVAKDRSTANALSITTAPSLMVGGTRLPRRADAGRHRRPDRAAAHLNASPHCGSRLGL